MNILPQNPTRAERVPCPHMRNVISPLADGNLRGLLLFYARHHVRGCVRCTEALTAMVALRAQLTSLGGFSTLMDAAGENTATEPPLRLLARERRVALNEAMNRLDAAVGGSDAAPVASTVQSDGTAAISDASRL